jgi:hypothetical protein
MCQSCAVEDSYCICGTFRQPLPDGQHCGCESGDSCHWCGHTAGPRREVPADTGDMDGEDDAGSGVLSYAPDDSGSMEGSGEDGSQSSE